MSSISAISSNYQYNIYSGKYINNDPLTSATRKKLIALGIPFTEQTTESEAQNLIKQATNAKCSQIKPTSANTDNNDMKKLFTKIKDLANKVGIVVYNDEDPKKILDRIDKQIKQLISSTPKENETAITQLYKYKTEHHELKTQLEKIISKQKQLCNQMEVMSIQNKISFGLN